MAGMTPVESLGHMSRQPDGGAEFHFAKEWGQAVDEKIEPGDVYLVSVDALAMRSSFKKHCDERLLVRDDVLARQSVKSSVYHNNRSQC